VCVSIYTYRYTFISIYSADLKGGDNSHIHCRRADWTLVQTRAPLPRAVRDHGMFISIRVYIYIYIYVHICIYIYRVKLDTILTYIVDARIGHWFKRAHRSLALCIAMVYIYIYIYVYKDIDLDIDIDIDR